MRRSLLLLFFLNTLGFACSADAQDPKAWLKKVDSSPPGPHLNLRPLQVNYELSWKERINAGKMEFSMTEPYPGVFKSQASGASVGLARALFSYNFSGTAQTNAETLKPMTFNFSDRMKNKSYQYSLLFQPSQLITHTDLTDLKTGKKTPYHRVYRFEQDIARDLMSSILYLRSQPLTKGQRISMVTATFNKPYLTDFKVLGREKRVIKRKSYNSIKLDLKISKIHSNMTVEPYSKIKSATFWVSDDEYRLPLEFQAEIFIGYIAAKMTKRKWL